MSCCWGNLPEELVAEILLKLPVKSLLRFKCVCKSWYALIKGANFVNQHLCYANTSSSGSLIFMLYDAASRKYGISLVSDETLKSVPSAQLKLPPSCEKLANWGDLFTFLGPVNGIYCIYDEYSDVVLWNPSTKEFRHLPPTDQPNIPRGELSAGVNTGFGFDPKTNDYKVIRIMTYCYEKYIDGPRFHRAELYTLSTDAWSELDPLLPCQITGLDIHNGYLSGAYHWLAYDNTRKKDLVLSFDMADEVFGTFLRPAAFEEDSFAEELLVIKGSLTLISYDHKEIGTCFVIWVMKEYAVEESWTKLASIGPFSECLIPVGCGKKHEVFLRTAISNEVCLIRYDAKSRELAKFQLGKVTGGSVICFHAVIYMESLVSIK